MAGSSAKPWHEAVRIRADIKNAELSLKAFAADLYDVSLGRNPGVYHDPADFFALTYPTLRLRDLARDVTRRLAGKSEKAVRQLHVTFGGGKTHALIALVHLVNEPEKLPDIPAVQEFRTHCDLGGGFPKARVAAVVFDRLDAEKGMAVKSPDGAIRSFKMPWSVLAWQLAGEAGMKLLRGDGSERDSVPATNVMEDLLELARRDAASVLVLFDEVLWFARTMADQDPAWVSRMADFLHSLTQAVAKVPQCCLVASLLASDTGKMDELGKRISKDLYDEFKRVADEGIQPVESQDVPEILRRRLFELDSYTDKSAWSRQVMAALNHIEKIDDHTQAHRADEEQRYQDAYPFHPDLIKLFYEKWTQLEGFQQTRGILKTLATALRDAERWDQKPIIGAQIFLTDPDKGEGLCAAARELADVARVEQYEGKRQNWPTILESELRHAAKSREGLDSLGGREIEQAVVSTFLHSQPIGRHAVARELKLLAGGSASDRIEFGKGLSRWADSSWYLDDTFTQDREDGIPKIWRLGSRPNLKQMHHDARNQIADAAVEDALEKEIGGAKNLTEGGRAAGAKVHVLPAKPADIEDDGEFHYAVLGPSAASESGKPSAESKRFIEQTTGPERPRARNRNAVVLTVPSRQGLEMARDKVRDYLAWSKVREALKGRDDIDATAAVRLEGNLKAARNEMSSQIVMAWCIAVTLDSANKIAAHRISVDNEPVFAKLLADKRLRIESGAINAEALLPGGPYDFWAQGEKSRYVKDLVGAFASSAQLPKMLDRQSILETLLQGCQTGDFVLRVTRADKSERAFWRCRPDDTALNDPSLEIVLSESARLAELDSQLLAPAALSRLWTKDTLTLRELADYFSGKVFVPVDKGGYEENQLVPEAAESAIKQAVSLAVEEGAVWLTNGTLSLLGESVPEGFLDENAILRPPPRILGGSDVSPSQLPNAWDNNETNAYLIHAALSADAGIALPWVRVKQALDEGFRLGLFALTADSADWPCDLGSASLIKLCVVEGVREPPAPHGNANTATAELEVHELQDLSDQIDQLKSLVAGQSLKLKMTVELGDSGTLDKKLIEGVNDFLDGIKAGWRLP